MFEKFIFDKILKKLASIEKGKLTVETPDHKKFEFEGNEEGPIAHIQILQWSCISQWVSRGDIGFAETYRDGLWETDDLLAVLNFAMVNRDVIAPYLEANKLQNALTQFLYLFQRNSIRP